MLGRIFSNFFSNIFAWLQALGSGAVLELIDFAQHFDATDPDVLQALAKGGIIAVIVRLLGAIIKAKQPA